MATTEEIKKLERIDGIWHAVVARYGDGRGWRCKYFRGHSTDELKKNIERYNSEDDW